MQPSPADIAKALADARADHAQYLARRDLRSEIKTALDLLAGAKNKRGTAPDAWTSFVCEGRLQLLIARAEGVSVDDVLCDIPSLKSLSCAPLDSRLMDDIERRLQLLADAAKGTQGRRKELAFFTALHLGYLFTVETGRAPTYTTRPDFIENTIGGAFVDFCHVCGVELTDRAIRDAIFEGQSSFDAVLIGAEPAPYLASGWVRRERRSETNP